MEKVWIIIGVVVLIIQLNRKANMKITLYLLCSIGVTAYLSETIHSINGQAAVFLFSFVSLLLFNFSRRHWHD